MLINSKIYISYDPPTYTVLGMIWIKPVGLDKYEIYLFFNAGWFKLYDSENLEISEIEGLEEALNNKQNSLLIDSSSGDTKKLLNEKGEFKQVHHGQLDSSKMNSDSNFLHITSTEKESFAEHGYDTSEEKKTVKDVDNTKMNIFEEETIATDLNSLNSKIRGLENIISKGIINYLLLEKADIQDLFLLGSPLINSGDEAPNKPPDFMGQLYIKTVSPKAIFMASGISSVGDWLQISN